MAVERRGRMNAEQVLQRGRIEVVIAGDQHVRDAPPRPQPHVKHDVHCARARKNAGCASTFTSK